MPILFLDVSIVCLLLQLNWIRLDASIFFLHLRLDLGNKYEYPPYSLRVFLLTECHSWGVICGQVIVICWLCHNRVKFARCMILETRAVLLWGVDSLSSFKHSARIPCGSCNLHLFVLTAVKTLWPRQTSKVWSSEQRHLYPTFSRLFPFWLGSAVPT